MRQTLSQSLCLHSSPGQWLSWLIQEWKKPKGVHGKEGGWLCKVDKEKKWMKRSLSADSEIFGLAVWIGSALLDCISIGSGLALAPVLHWPSFVRFAGRTGRYSKIVPVLFGLNLYMNGGYWVFADDISVVVTSCTNAWKQWWDY